MKLALNHFVGSGKIIARKIGVEAAYKLLETYGGQTFYIALNPTEANTASKLLGLDVHKVLSEFYPNKKFELPLISHVDANLRNDCILADTKTMPMSALIKKYGISRAALQNIKRNHLACQDINNNDQTEQLNLELF